MKMKMNYSPPCRTPIITMFLYVLYPFVYCYLIRGLDSHSCYQVVSLLKHLAAQGRTIICTIHQPSARLFQQFEQVYILAMGECLYQGGTEKMVSYLQSVNLPCPVYHNPADYSKCLFICQMHVRVRVLVRKYKHLFVWWC